MRDIWGVVMRKAYVGFVFPSLLAASIAAGSPASAITFSKLTTIYVGAGVRDDGGADHIGVATSFHCSNVSGLTATVRFVVLAQNGSSAGSFTANVVHGSAITVSTHATNAYIETHSIGTGGLHPGVVNIESTQSGVFCTAEVIHAASTVPVGVSRNLVRINPHPGTVE
jgi:hypothetical protein